MGTEYFSLYALSGLYDFISRTSLKDDGEVELYRHCILYKSYLRKAIRLFERCEKVPFPASHIDRYTFICGTFSGVIFLKRKAFY